MTALARASDYLQSARREIASARCDAPPWAVDSIRVLSAEADELRRRIENVRRATGDFGRGLVATREL